MRSYRISTRRSSACTPRTRTSRTGGRRTVTSTRSSLRSATGTPPAPIGLGSPCGRVTASTTSRRTSRGKRPLDDVIRQARDHERSRLRDENEHRNAAIRTALHQVPRFDLPNRAYYLLQGPVAAVTSCVILHRRASGAIPICSGRTTGDGSSPPTWTSGRSTSEATTTSSLSSAATSRRATRSSRSIAGSRSRTEAADSTSPRASYPDARW